MTALFLAFFCYQLASIALIGMAKQDFDKKLFRYLGNARHGQLAWELAPRVNEAVQALIIELADVEADFQLEDLLFLLKKMMRNIRNLSFALDQMKNLIDFALTAEPLLKSSVPQVISYLDDLEQRGVLRLLGMVLMRFGYQRTASSFTELTSRLR